MWQKLFISTRKKKIGLGPLDNQDGQIAIFIALIFQVLFIFFAMLINIGLIVHDKINLQNSVDLAAYYGAERQAELLNEIAHINYQIRQEYKLLAWRQRILGTYNFNANHGFMAAPPDKEDLDFPATCVDHAGWSEVYDTDKANPVDNCQESITTKPAVPKYNVIATFLPINSYLQGFFAKVADAVKVGCEAVGPLNWYTTSLWFFEYKQAVRARSEMIRTLGANLSQPGTRFLDITNKSVLEGVKRTFIKNLTEANRNSISSKGNYQIDNASDFTFINSLSTDVPGDCSTITNGNPFWLHENLIGPKLAFVNSLSTGGNGSGCQTFPQMLDFPPTGAGMSKYNSANTNILMQYNTAEPKPGEHTSGYSSLGFEKNPWCLAYVGVKATSRPRKPFAPFGKPVSLVARGFASPFGGRIGPWTHSTWASGSQMSIGGTIVDPLVVPRTEDSGVPAPAKEVDKNTPYIPNHSRYPGDTLGLRSMLVHYLYGISFLNSVLSGSPNSVQSQRPKINGYDALFNPANTDSLYQDPDAKGNIGLQPVRGLESAAVAPDLFDITYYSIDADYYSMYYNPNMILAGSIPPMADLGSSLANPGSNVQMQMILAKSKLFDVKTKYAPAINWLVPNLDYLLTGWIQGRTGDYGPTPAQFQTCQVHPNYKDGWPPVPGFCVVGGRTGYSVRMIGRKYLRTAHALGGAGSSAKNIITNPPPSGW